VCQTTSLPSDTTWRLDLQLSARSASTGGFLDACQQFDGSATSFCLSVSKLVQVRLAATLPSPGGSEALTLDAAVFAVWLSFSLPDME